ncbi:hypothetical protein DV736_g3927, partial [Chaetothyriales sp. CBS 134916]
MDPQSRTLLELSYQALENAGIPLAKCTGTNTSVYIGCSADDYRLIYAKDPERPIRYAATGMARSMLANKISCFDDRANGYSRGEGHGMLVLKLLPNAIRDRDRIRAVIRATGSNENGRTPGGITKVDVKAQERLIRETYRSADLELCETRLVEAHGPGTSGDVVECAGLASVFSKFRNQEEPLYVSSVKANMGHLEGASGIPSLVKTILALERGVIPRLANFRHLHPDIATKNYPFSFPTENIPWPSGLRRASINSFGFGGSNAHVVMEDALSHIANIQNAVLPLVQNTQTVECGMMAIGLDFNSVATYIEELSQTFAPVEVYIACQNAPSSITIAGSKVQLKYLEEIFKREIDGLARALRSEHENLKLITLCFEESPDLVENIADAVLLNISSDGPLHPLRRYEPEQAVMQDGTLYVSRLEEDKYMNELLKEQDKPMVHGMQPFGAASDLKLGIGTPGALDTFHFEEDLRSRLDLAADEIEVRPIYAGLNFMDCLTALGQIPQAVLGVECSGVVLRAGCGSDLRPGTRVMLCTDGTFGSRTRCHYQNAIRIPHEMPLEVAGGLLGAGGTAYHALCNIARLQAGESILIHAGAGATGQMAIQVANHIGAEVYVTVGSHKKAELVKDVFGIPEDNILYSRNTDFAEAIDRITHGRGVDVVLNSLAGDSLSASWRCIAPFGRFVEIGKKDIYQNKQLSMLPFAKNASFATVDLAGIWHERPWLMRKIAEELLSLWKAGKLKVPCPLQVFEIGKVEEAFRVMQSGKGTGKIVLRMDPECIVPTYLRRQPRYKLCPDATYLISGGFGGLGIIAARWMVSRG